MQRGQQSPKAPFASRPPQASQRLSLISDSYASIYEIEWTHSSTNGYWPPSRRATPSSKGFPKNDVTKRGWFDWIPIRENGSWKKNTTRFEFGVVFKTRK